MSDNQLYNLVDASRQRHSISIQLYYTPLECLIRQQ